jgi:hypothetical protein
VDTEIMEEIVTDDELIARLQRDFEIFSEGGSSEVIENSKRLIALARRGAAVKWRPIEEAPNDGGWLLGDFGDGYDLRPMMWMPSKKSWCDVPDGDRFDDGKPTRFIPLSALGEPET